jgi:hypothetical protein
MTIIDVVVTVAAMILGLAGRFDGTWTLKDGVNVSFVFVQPAKHQAWRPSGIPLDPRAILRNLKGVVDLKADSTVLVAWISSANGLATAPSIAFQPRPNQPTQGALSNVAPPTSITILPRLAVDSKSWVGALPYAVRPSESQDILVGVAVGSWKTVGSVAYTSDSSGLKVVKRTGMAFGPVIESAPSADPSNSKAANTSVTVHDLQSSDPIAIRFVAKDRLGRETFFGDHLLPSPGKTLGNIFAGDYHDLRRIEVQTRPSEWTILSHAHFLPTKARSSSR